MAEKDGSEADNAVSDIGDESNVKDDNDLEDKMGDDAADDEEMPTIDDTAGTKKIDSHCRIHSFFKSPII